MKTKIFWGLVIFLFCCTVGEIIVFKILSGKLETSSKKTLTSKKAATRPDRQVKESSEIQKELSLESLTDEELEECLAWLEGLEEQDETIEQSQHNEERDNSSHPDRSLSVESPQTENSSESKTTEEVRDILDWPATGRYYIRDVLRYRPDAVYSPNRRAYLEALVAKNPDDTMSRGGRNNDPRDPNSGFIHCQSDGRGGRIRIPAYKYYENREYYDRLAFGEFNNSRE